MHSSSQRGASVHERELAIEPGRQLLVWSSLEEEACSRQGPDLCLVPLQYELDQLIEEDSRGHSTLQQPQLEGILRVVLRKFELPQWHRTAEKQLLQNQAQGTPGRAVDRERARNTAGKLGHIEAPFELV